MRLWITWIFYSRVFMQSASKIYERIITLGFFALCSSNVARCWCPKPAILGFIGCGSVSKLTSKALSWRVSKCLCLFFFFFSCILPSTCTRHRCSASLCIIKCASTKETVHLLRGVVLYICRYLCVAVVAAELGVSSSRFQPSSGQSD